MNNARLTNPSNVDGASGAGKCKEYVASSLPVHT